MQKWKGMVRTPGLPCGQATAPHLLRHVARQPKFIWHLPWDLTCTWREAIYQAGAVPETAWVLDMAAAGCPQHSTQKAFCAATAPMLRTACYSSYHAADSTQEVRLPFSCTVRRLAAAGTGLQ